MMIDSQVLVALVLHLEAKEPNVNGRIILRELGVVIEMATSAPAGRHKAITFMLMWEEIKFARFVSQLTGKIDEMAAKLMEEGVPS